jgi:mannose-6-phosphate isomerase-like protein (cupin superfamily)
MGDQLLSKHDPFASDDLGKYGNHYFLLAARNNTGSSELHEHEADVFVVEQGEASFITGGTMINPKTTAAGEIRGTGIQGGQRHTLSVGDVVQVPAGVPHQLILDKGQPFVYFVVKVSGQ